MLVDSHAHIHDKAFDDDRDGIVQRMHAAGVVQAITVGCNLPDSARALTAAERYRLYASVGIHPHEAADAPDDLAEAFGPFLSDPRIVAVGETGLDYYYDHSPRERQREVLRKQIEVAKSHGKPVIFHHRDAFEDFAAILREHWAPGMRGVVHCFTGDTAQAQTYVGEFGLLLGIGGVITFKTAQQVRDAVAAAGSENLILETDCPYLAPVPYRGRRNEPAFVTATAEKVAEILSLDVEHVAEVTTHNAARLFGLAL